MNMDECAEETGEECGNESVRFVRYRQLEFSLAGNLPTIGDEAPDFLVTQWVDKLRVQVSLVNLLLEKCPILLTTSHTVDSPNSVLQLLQLERMLTRFSGQVRAVHVSSDLPFTLNRCLASNNIQCLKAASDYLFRSFEAYGVLMDDPQILCRAAFVIDKTGIVRYAEVPNDFSTELDYERIATSLDALLSEGRSEECLLEESDSETGDSSANAVDGTVDMDA
jgi:thiol peroxidase